MTLLGSPCWPTPRSYGFLDIFSGRVVASFRWVSNRLFVRVPTDSANCKYQKSRLLDFGYNSESIRARVSFGRKRFTINIKKMEDNKVKMFVFSGWWSPVSNNSYIRCFLQVKMCSWCSFFLSLEISVFSVWVWMFSPPFLSPKPSIYIT